MPKQIFIALIILLGSSFLQGCRARSDARLKGSGGVEPVGIENQLAIPLIKYQRDFHGELCPEGEAFFSFCAASLITTNLALTSRHCIIRENLDTKELEASDVLWFHDHKTMHNVLRKREKCLNIEETVRRLKAEAGAMVLPKEGIISPKKDGKFLEFPDFAFVRDPRFAQSNYRKLPLLDPNSLAPGTEITKIGFGATDCSKPLTPELRAKYPGYEYQYDRHRVSRYGVSKTHAEILDKDSMERVSPKNAAKRDFDNFLYYLAGKRGMFGCLSDGTATLVKRGEQYYIVGAHRGGVTLYDETPGAAPKSPTPFKLEIAIKVNASDVCPFVLSVPEAKPLFERLCASKR